MPEETSETSAATPAVPAKKVTKKVAKSADIKVVVTRGGIMWAGGSPQPGGVVTVPREIGEGWINSDFAKLVK